MPLFQADSLLTHARLQIADQISRHAPASGSSAPRSASEPEPRAGALRRMSPEAAIAEARRLIEKHGYHRRDQELADAEAALQARPGTTGQIP